MYCWFGRLRTLWWTLFHGPSVPHLPLSEPYSLGAFEAGRVSMTCFLTRRPRQCKQTFSCAWTSGPNKRKRSLQRLHRPSMCLKHGWSNTCNLPTLPGYDWGARAAYAVGQQPMVSSFGGPGEGCTGAAAAALSADSLPRFVSIYHPNEFKFLGPRQSTAYYEHRFAQDDSLV